MAGLLPRWLDSRYGRNKGEIVRRTEALCATGHHVSDQFDRTVRTDKERTSPAATTEGSPVDGFIGRRG